MKRRVFIKNVFWTSASTVLMNCSRSSNQKKNIRPNILLIHTDQHRIDCLGAYGNKQVKTPNIDALATDGVLYNNSFCPYPVCTPSRYSLITGLYVREHGGYSNHSTLLPDVDTFPAMLKNAGYATKAVGKMHYTPTYLDVGFSEMELAEQDGPGRWDDDYHRYLRDHDLVDYNDLEDQLGEYRKQAPDSYFANKGAIVSNLPEEHHSTTWIGDRAVDSIHKWQSNQSNLLMVGFIKPHHPFDPPANWAEMYDPDEMEILAGWTDECLQRDLVRSKGYFPHTQLTKSALKQAMAYYYAGISQIDFHVGRMIKLLKQKGLYDNTMIIFTSDHGEYLGFHHMLLKGNYLYDPLAKVPLIIKYPGSKGHGIENNDLVNNIDVAPTILKASGLQPTAAMQGYDLTEPNPRKVLISENGRKTVMARTHTRKLIVDRRNQDSEIGLLFDLEQDPFEKNNIFNEQNYQSERALLLTAIREWKAETTFQEMYVNENAPQINRPNVPLDLNHRESMIQYYREKMSK